MELSVMMDIFTSALPDVAATSQPLVAPENLKCGKCDGEATFSVLINCN